MRRRHGIATVSAFYALLTLATAAPPAQAAAQAPAQPNPVIFIHGRNADPGVWGRMQADFTAAGYPTDRLFGWSYDTAQSSNEVLAARLSAYVDDVLAQTHAAKADIVAHSLGSLPSRWYLEFGGGTAKTAHWVSLAGPNHGTQIAWLCALWDQGCKDMTPDSYVLRHLNQGTETPGPTRYATWWSSCDEQITPAVSTELAGAANTRTAACLRHNDFLTDPTVSQGVRDFLATP
ncbi:esterase/lipase family protein [Streptomyces sp. NPDC001262]|uniref:esterase/lipase family protein n=1 Tax=Streptomyces TaxID=1883 RepID=UPI0036BE1942